jgi:hypothetical protein
MKIISATVLSHEEVNGYNRHTSLHLNQYVINRSKIYIHSKCFTNMPINSAMSDCTEVTEELNEFQHI